VSERLGTRFYVVGAVLGALLTFAFVVMLLAIDDLRDTSRAELRSQEIAIAAAGAESATLELSTGLRGFLLTGEDRFLVPARQAQAELPRQLEVVRRLTAGDAVQAARAAELAPLIATYDDYVREQVAAGADRSRPELAASASGAKARLDPLRSRFAAFIAAERRRTAELERAADATARRAAILGVICFVLLLAAVPLSLAYLLRSVVAPVRAIGDAARRLAAGEPKARAPESGAGEVGALAHAFNAMAGALEVSRTELEHRGVRLVETNRQLRGAFAELERSKQRAILELSTPILQLEHGLLVLPVIGSVDLERAQQLDTRLLYEVRDKRARVVVLDVTGVPEIDTPVANQLLQTVASVRLLGARVIMTGVSGELAAALVGLDVDFALLKSYADLQRGVESATGRS